MLKRISALNNSRNRQLQLTDENSLGFLIEVKNGTTFFGWKIPNHSAKFYKCEEEVFAKNFHLEQEEAEIKIDLKSKFHFEMYP